MKLQAGDSRLPFVGKIRTENGREQREKELFTAVANGFSSQTSTYMEKTRSISV